MRKIIRAAYTDESKAYTKAKRIQQAASNLLDIMEDTPSGFLDNNDLGPLYEELLETIQTLDYAIESHKLII